MIVADDGQPVLGNQDYPTREVASDALAEMGRGEGSILRVQAESRRPAIKITITVSSEFRDFLDELSAEMKQDRAEVLRKAVTLLRIARDARRDGNRLAIITPDFEVDQEITGF